MTIGPYLQPAPTPTPLYGDELDDFFQQWVVGVTGMDAKLVRPRWQPEPPNEPPMGSDWAAVGFISIQSDTFATEQHVATGEGYTLVYRQEQVNFLASFYGPNAHRNASILREGASVAQNREIFSTQGMALNSTGDLQSVPTLKNDRWQARFDVPVVVTRAIVRKYDVKNLLSAEGEIVTDNDPPLEQPINVQE